jgi:hypothetical protein
MKNTLLLFTTCFLLIACKESPENNQESQSDTQETAAEVGEAEMEYPSDPKFNDFARFIAGQEGSETSSLKSLESSEIWTSFRSSLDPLWKKTNDKLPIIREWTSSEMADVNAEGGTLFYPFAGADFLHADLFFPEYDNICMIALEPIGKFPDLNQKAKDNTLAPYMNQLKKSMHAILGLSFFRTIAMEDDFQSDLDGTLHVLMHFMARTDHEVLYQEQVAILPNGDITNDLSQKTDTTFIGNRYYFRKNGEKKVRTLTYFVVNMQNEAYGEAAGLATRSDALAYFKKLDIKATYLKSASYLLHRETFSIIRNLILKESEFLLQDDSAIPLKYFQDGRWDLTFYGTYTRPIRLFYDRHQPDLAEAYRDPNNTVKDLPFGIGYQYRPGTSNVMKAVKK